ncbi:MAG TPA: DUF4382 domain-containing protein [Anaeromyxobacteraceae bacterium]|nr:DUF4382 domain-containing protein [Anaeromyxobacteraceae bacterium]
MTTHRSTRRIAATFAGALLAAACGPGAQTANQVQNPPPSGKAQLAVTMTATTASPSQQVAPGTPVGAVPQVKAVIVNVTQVTAHVAGIGWKTIGTTAPGPIDVLKLSDPSNALALGLVTLDPGTVTQVRLLVAQDGNQVVFPDDTTAPLKVPSGYQSGIKIHGPWTVSACNRASVTLELDGKKSIWFHPASGGDEWILRPVIRVKRTEASDVGCGGTGEGAGTPPAPAPTPTGEACNEGRECLTTVCSANVCARAARRARLRERRLRRRGHLCRSADGEEPGRHLQRGRRVPLERLRRAGVPGWTAGRALRLRRGLRAEPALLPGLLLAAGAVALIP